MNRLFFGSTLLCIVSLMVGSIVFSNNIFMEFASTSIIANIGRGCLAVLLLGVLCTAPPRKFYMRVLMGLGAVLLVVGGIYMSFGNTMQILDVLLYFAAACALAIEALEFNEDELRGQIERYHTQYRQSLKA